MTALRSCWCIAFAVFLTAASPCSAQSVLSMQYPGGLPIAHATGPSIAIAGAGTGVRNDFFGMADNVANLGGMNRAVFSASTSLDFNSIHEGSSSSSFLTLSPRLFSFSFAIAPVGTFGFSLDQRTSMRLKIVRFFDTTLNNGIQVTDSIGIAQRGGVKSWQAGWGRAIGRWGFVGLSYERIYLSSENINRESGTLGDGITLPADDSTRYLFRGNAVRGGILVPVRKLTFGMSGEYVFKDNAKKTVRATMTARNSDTKFSLSLPPSLSFGVSYSPSPSWMAAASSGITLWQSYRSTDTLGGKVDNAWSIAAGVQYVPAPNLLVPRYWEVMQYRLGIRYCELPVVTGSEFALTAGVGLPLLKGGGLLDCIAEFGIRSDSRHTTYSERFLHLYVGINGGRRWSQKTGIRY
jgi:hypothetical protein